MSVVENVCLPLTDGRSRLSRTAAREKALIALGQVGMDQFADRSAALLSGGQQQRVALARALAVDPQLMLMDEPLSNLDAQLRETVRSEIRRLARRLRTTVVYVTHDRVEAMALADRIVILDEGRIVQVGPPDETYRLPATPRVADFLGAVNWLNGVVTTDGGIETPVGTLHGVDHDKRLGSRVLTGIRPESIQLIAATSGALAEDNSFEARVEDVMFLGEYTLYHMELYGQPLVVRSLAHLTGRDTLWVRLPAQSIMVFESDRLPEAGSAPRVEVRGTHV
jgi:ABC-type Fe3+/spermidine/putrescine transport system ATPase subunit